VFTPPAFGAADAAVFETFVVPRYLAYFGDVLQEMLLVGAGARVAHLGCRVGYPDQALLARVPMSTLVGVDATTAYLELARSKALVGSPGRAEYLTCATLPTALTSEAFSHVLALHPSLGRAGRVELFQEMARLLYRGGQALVALPMRGSFPELWDLLREFALKHDEGDLGRAIDAAVLSRPNLEGLSEELEEAGLDDIDVETRVATLVFDSGRAFFEDPVTRLLLVPELTESLGRKELERPMAYLRDAIDKYWSEGSFELTVHVGCASARK